MTDDRCARDEELYWLGSHTACTRPTSPEVKRTLMPWGWAADLVRSSRTTPSVRVPDAWSFFCTIRTREPALMSARLGGTRSGTPRQWSGPPESRGFDNSPTAGLPPRFPNFSK